MGGSTPKYAPSAMTKLAVANARVTGGSESYHARGLCPISLPPTMRGGMAAGLWLAAVAPERGTGEERGHMAFGRRERRER